MAIIPLIGWSGASGKKFMNKLALPFGISAALGAVVYGYGVTDLGALAGYFIAILALATTFIEIVQGARARAKNTRENIFVAMRGLVERNRQRYGGYLVHVAIAMMAIGIIGSQVYATDSTRALELGKSFDVRGYTLKYEKLDPNVARGEGVATVATLGVFRGDQRIATLQPERIFYERAGETNTNPAILSSPQEDLYVIIAGWENNFATVTFRAYVNPLVFWLWFGGLMLIVSTLIATGPDYRVEARVREDVERIAKESVRA
jgi:cytochrome c-type biogenesis protein CcmF